MILWKLREKGEIYNFSVLFDLVESILIITFRS